MTTTRIIFNKRQWVIWCSVILLLSTSISSSAESLILNDATERLNIDNQFEYFVDNSALLGIQEILSSEQKVEFTKAKETSFGYSKSAYWIKLSVINRASSQFEWYLVQDFTNTHYLDLYLLDADGRLLHKKLAGNLRKNAERDVLDRHSIFKLTLPASSQHTVYLRVSGGGSMHIHLAFWRPDVYASIAKWDSMFLGGFHGVLIVLFFYNLIIYIYLRDVAYRWISVFIASVVVAASVYQGLAQLVINDHLLLLSNYAIPLSVPIMGIGLLKFTDEILLPLQISTLKIDRVHLTLIYLTWAEYLVVPDYVLAMHVMGPIFLASLLFCVYRLSISYNRQDNTVKWYSFAWLVMLVTLIPTVLSNFNFIPSNIVTVNAYLFGISVMILFMSIALANRVYTIRVHAERSQNALAESESQRRLIMQAGKLGLWIWELRENRVLWSEECESIFGLSKGQFGGTYEHFFKLAHPDDIEYLRDSIQLSLKNRTSFNLEYRILPREDSTRWVSSYGKIEYDDNNVPLRMKGTIQDITEYMQAKEELRASELNYKHLFDSAADGFLIISKTGEIVNANPVAFDMYGYSKEEFLNLTVNRLIHNDTRYIESELQQLLLKGNTRITDEALCIRKDGTQFSARIRANIMSHQNKPHIFIAVSDISKQKRLQDAMAFLATGIADKSNVVFFQQLVLYLARLYHAKYIYVGIYNTDQSNGLECLRGLAFCKDGKIEDDMDFVLAGSVCDSASDSNTIVKTSNVKINFPHDDILRKLSIESLICENLVSSSGSRLGVIMILDVNVREDFYENSELLKLFNTRCSAEIERMLAEDILKQLNTKLETIIAERTTDLTHLNQELESFSYSVSHDLRAPLRSINGFSQLLLEDFGEILNSEGQNYLNRIASSTKKMATLIDDLLALSRVTRRELDVKEFNISKIVSDSIVKCQELEPRSQVNISVEPNLIAQGDPNLISVAIENLVSNAWKYTRNSDTTTIRFGSTQNDTSTVYFLEDNGTGFEMQFIDKIFKPFHRLHKPDDFEGTGIGLATVQRIIKRHNGSIWATSIVGKGTTFYFFLHGNDTSRTFRQDSKLQLDASHA